MRTEETKIYNLTKPDGNGGLFVLVDRQVLCFRSVWAEEFKKGGEKRPEIKGGEKRPKIKEEKEDQK